ncbi:MAG: flagellin [Eubacterium sp.]|nr:flagellin [Eubacterium sp.]
MRVNHNISAVIANNNLLVNEDRLASSLEKLSSGLRINSAKDDPTGIAISRTMKAQIDGLNQASDNAADGDAVIDTADSVLGELTSMLQRMRELAVQGANGTNTESDLKAIQEEMDSLTEEIDRISKDTEYNTINLFDGSLARRVYSQNANGQANVVQMVSITSQVQSGAYRLSDITTATQATYTGGTAETIGTTHGEGSISINGVTAYIDADATADEIWQTLQDLGESAGVTVTSSSTGTDLISGASLTFTSIEYGSGIELNISCDSDISSLLGIDSDVNTAGTNTTGSIYKYNENTGAYELMDASVTAAGNTVSITARDGVSMSFIVDPDKVDASDNYIDLDVTDIGRMRLQIGANENQIINIDIQELTSETLGIDNLNVRNQDGAARAIGNLDSALTAVNSLRARLGAYSNRLEHTEANLDATAENMTSALSRITDVDMAEEMTTYTNMQVITQAATSVLAQANEIPEQALQLLK